ncbi:MAG TPA: ABC transporter substrate-binding protein [Methylomirabilota bacterium]|jgi:iron(III) transport system substrate-binding protein|nr:ABC transporter substrate-binding protein [Methylomirabilota bacterium]
MRLALARLLFLASILLLAAGRPAPAAEEVVVYSSVDEENAKKLLDTFTRATGVQVRFTFLSSGPAVARLEAEKANPRADLWFGAPSENHVAAKEKGLTQAYVSPNARDLAAHFRDKEGYWTSFYMNPLGLGVNTKVIKERGAPVPASWEDLLRPEFRNQIQMPSPQTSGTGYNMVAALVQMWGEDRAFEYLKRLHPNVQTYTQSGTAPSKAAAIGQAAIGIQFTPAFLQLADEGYPMQIAFPKEGVGFEAPAISIVKGASHLDAAKKLVDWFLTLDGQNAFTDAKTYFFPVHPKAKLAKGLPPFDQIPVMNYDAVRAGQDKKRLVDRWINEVLRAPK